MTELMGNALDLMMVGMGFVFSFLIILVFVTMIMSLIATRISPAEAKPVRTSGGNRTGGGSSPMDDPKLMAVISAAVSKYRDRHRQ